MSAKIVSFVFHVARSRLLLQILLLALVNVMLLVPSLVIHEPWNQPLGKQVNPQQERQDERDARVARLRIVPGDVTLSLDQRIVFAVVAYDAQDEPVGGVGKVWRADNIERDQQVRISQEGEFVPPFPGRFRVMAKASRHQAQVIVTVPDITGQASNALAMALPQDGSGWNDTNIDTAFDPSQRRGRDPVDTSHPMMLARASLGIRRDSLNSDDDTSAGSGNFQLAAPIVHLAGRGLDLALDLHYNSRVWHKAGDQIFYDIDEDWPAPGWSLGFGKLVKTGQVGAMLVDVDGTRHASNLIGIGGDPSTGREYARHTTDGTLIDYTYKLNSHQDLTSARVKYPNGTFIDFTAPGLGGAAIYPTRITDTNGNYMTITYRNNTGPELNTITDTLGRTISFHYDTHNLLTAITGPGLNGGTRTLIRLHYRTLTLQYAFKHLNPNVRDKAPWLIDAIYYPGSATGFWFGDPDSFSSYGMVAKVSEQHAMDFAADLLTEQGMIASGVRTREKVYNYPLSPDPTLDDAPMYTTMTEIWEAMDSPPAVTRYVVTPGQIEVTLPNGTKNVQLSYYASGLAPSARWKDGLVFRYETYDASDNLLRKSTVTWELGAYESPRPVRTDVRDERNQISGTEFSYGAYNQVEEIREYDYGGTLSWGPLLRRVHTDYETTPGYVDQHIFNLPSVVQVYGSSWPIESYTEYHYDGQPLVDAPGVVQHTECRTICEGGYWEGTSYYPALPYRGNLTEVKRYADVVHRTGIVIEKFDYDITGNRVTAATACCEQMSFTYTSATQYAYPVATARGAADPTSSARVTTQSTYDFNTGLGLSTTDANGRTTQTAYFAATLQPSRVTRSTGATTSFDYDDAALRITETTRDATGKIVGRSVKQLNGLGLVRRTQVLAEGTTEGFVERDGVFQREEVPLWDIVETQYDMLGRLWKETRPFASRIGEVAQWSEISYDALGRVTGVRAPDGSEVRTYYNEVNRPSGAGGGPGQTMRVVDAWGRERWTLTDALGRLQEVVEPNPEDSGSLFEMGHTRTRYVYNAIDQLVLVLQGAQLRRFQYDGLGRLTHQDLPEKLDTLNDAGEYRGPGSGWSDVFTYDERSNLRSHTDARGVKTIYDYANDPLNRLQTVTYDTTGFGDTANPILPANSTTYQYVTAGDVTRLWRVTTSTSAEEYEYDIEGQLKSKAITLTSQPAYPQIIDYNYDSLNRLAEIVYPTEYGIAGQPRKLVRYAYDVASRLKGVEVGYKDGGGYHYEDYASQITYDAAGQMTSLKLGSSGLHQLREEYAYDPATGWLIHQDVQRIERLGDLLVEHRLLDLSYDYLRPGTSSGRSGQVTRTIDNLDGQQSQSYEYDALGRLKRATARQRNYDILTEWTQEYSYDGYGNRTNVTASGTTADGTPILRDGLATLSYDEKTNRITTMGFAYDATGNLTHGLIASGSGYYPLRYQYDAAGRLVKVFDDVAGDAVEVFTYGADKQRLVTQYGEASHKRTSYVWNGDAVIAEYNQTEYSVETDPRWTKSYVYLGGRLLATLAPGGAAEVVQFDHPDRLGTRRISNATDTTVMEQVTLPFGVALDAESSGATNRRFTSYDRSALTGVDYAVNRYYDPQQGRFMQVDPLGIQAASLANPQSLNNYNYVRNDPVNATDPLGLLWMNAPGCGMLPGDESVLGGCISVLEPFSIVPDNSPSGTGWGDARLRKYNFSSEAEAVKAALCHANPRSISENIEYAGLIYETVQGAYDYTDPAQGNDQGSNPFTTLPAVPVGAKLIGDYHTHADYSIKDPLTGKTIRTGDPLRDHFNSDDFSGTVGGVHGDRPGITTDAAVYGPGYKGYLGTPSRVFKAFDPATGSTTSLGGADCTEIYPITQ